MIRAKLLCSLFVSLLAVLFIRPVGADTVKEQLTHQYDSHLNRLFSSLTSNPELASQPKWLMQLAEKEIVSHWDIDSTLLAMIGRTQWQRLNETDQKALQQSFKLTLIRYFMEAHSYYDGQTVRLDSLQLNQTQDKGWLKLLIELDYMPDMTVDLSLIKQDDRWLFRDLRFQGISYTRMKRGFYQSMLKEKGVKQLIAELDAKNRSFFQRLGLQDWIRC